MRTKATLSAGLAIGIILLHSGCSSEETRPERDYYTLHFINETNEPLLMNDVLAATTFFCDGHEYGDGWTSDSYISTKAERTMRPHGGEYSIGIDFSGCLIHCTANHFSSVDLAEDSLSRAIVRDSAVAYIDLGDAYGISKSSTRWDDRKIDIVIRSGHMPIAAMERSEPARVHWRKMVESVKKVQDAQ